MAEPYSKLKVPDPDSDLKEILRFSQYFGYKNAADRMDRIYQRVLEAYREGRLEEIPLKELGNTIFFIFRASRHSGTDLTGEDMKLISSALKEMRAKSED